MTGEVNKIDEKSCEGEEAIVKAEGDLKVIHLYFTFSASNSNLIFSAFFVLLSVRYTKP